MGLTVETIALAVRRAGDCAVAIEQELNAADGKLGDGDTGVTLRRVLERMSLEDGTLGDDVGAYFGRLATAASSATGSSLGTLVAVALMTLRGETKGREEVPWEDLGRHLAAARDAMIARGGASLGDKTVLDALDAAASAIDGENDPAAMGHKAAQAAEATLDTFRHKPCRIGRARMFSDKSVGLDDPGMMAFARLTRAVAGLSQAKRS